MCRLISKDFTYGKLLGIIFYYSNPTCTKKKFPDTKTLLIANFSKSTLKWFYHTEKNSPQWRWFTFISQAASSFFTKQNYGNDRGNKNTILFSPCPWR